MKNLITSETVCIGHPDKMCDMIADNLLDAYLEQDSNSRTAIEVMATKDKVIVSGEVTSRGIVDIEKIVRKTICDIGYDNDEALYNGNKVTVEIIMNTQSPDISMGVNREELGAGDQGMMFGYATDETNEYMPITCVLANKIAKRLEEVRRKGIIPYLLPDGKCQVTIDASTNKIDKIVVSNQHLDVDMQSLREDIKNLVIMEAIPKDYLQEDTKYFINPTGRFRIGGPVGDTGLTGRKIIVDTYGGIIPHGGGAFSGKDYTKVDRSAAYYARYVAKNIVASGVCHKLMITVAYSIGIAKPVSLHADIYEDNQEKLDLVYEIINKFFDFRPSNIVEELQLNRPIYHKTTAYGHFGKDDLPYEKLDKVEAIKEYLNR